ncbi:MAG: L-2-hydroxyglutarate oxidase [Nitrospirae bacterium]|nr:L-2-hydroxyglutarate oxidase [Nitrospirota bacterium]
MNGSNTESVDVLVAGGGVIGCAVARALLLHQPGLKLGILEKEPELAMHQSGRNSGVVHVGYNQKPGTLKARFVVEGSRRLREFCKAHHVPVVEDGILIVAKTEREVETLNELHRRGQLNGARVERLDEKDLRIHEPYAVGIAALWAPEGASFDSKGYVNALAREAGDRGAKISCSEAVLRLKEEGRQVSILTTKRRISAGVLVNAAGLHADRLARQFGLGAAYQIIPFRGAYYEIIPEKRSLVRAHIYPAPDLKFPFLGVHLSRTFDGRVKVGPGAILAFGREAYGRFGFNLPDLIEMFRYNGFWRMFSSKEFRTIMKREWKKNLSRTMVLREAQLLVAGLEKRDLVADGAGVRAQLVSREGRMVDDLVIEETSRSVHVLNAVSPALTCSLPFADYIGACVAKKL